MILACRRMDRMLSYLADGELDDRQRARVEQHLHACPRCQARLQAYQHTKQAVAEYEPIPMRRLHAAAAPAPPDRRALWLAAAAMALSLAAFVPFAWQRVAERQARLPWDPGYTLSGLPAGAVAEVSQADERTLVVRVQDHRRGPLATVAFLRGCQVTPDVLTGRYGWDGASVSQAAARPQVQAWRVEAGPQGLRRLGLVAWNERGYCVTVREERAGTPHALAQIVAALQTGAAGRIGALPRRLQPQADPGSLLRSE